MQMAPLKSASFAVTHGQTIQPVNDFVATLLQHKQARMQPARLSKGERADIARRIAALDTPKQIQGVDFSRCVPTALIHHRKLGQRIEFETIGPYVADYLSSGGQMAQANLKPQDAIGMRLTTSFRQLFPQARLVSLIDDYNALQTSGADTSDAGHFSPQLVTSFRQSFVSLLAEYGAISADTTHGKEYLLLSEASRVAAAETLVAKLDTLHVIRRTGQEITFHNPSAENPLLQTFPLRTKTGKWLCHTLDATTFMDQQNLGITHIIALPAYMKPQQDKVWELLRILGFEPLCYHNIFYDPAGNPEAVAGVIEAVFAEAARAL